MNLNWFKFEPAKWAMGRISKQKDAVAGAFVRLMCKYWSEGCDMTAEDAELETGAAAYKSLVDAKILKIVAGKAHINFLDEQWKKELEKHENRKEWGAKGGHRKAEKAKPEDTYSQPLGSLEDTHSIPLAEASRREEKRREDNTPIIPFDEFERYALTKVPDVDRSALKLKYDSWVELGWGVPEKGGVRKIQNWKNQLCNTLPYIKKVSKKSTFHDGY